MIASTLSGSICRSTVRLSPCMIVFSLIVMSIGPHLLPFRMIAFIAYSRALMTAKAARVTITRAAAVMISVRISAFTSGSLIRAPLEVQGAGDDAPIIDPPTDLYIQGQLDRHLQTVRAVVVLAHRVLGHLL